MRKVLALAVTLSVLLTTQFIIWKQQNNVAVTPETIAGNPVDRFDPPGATVGTVIVAHGFSANKTMMRHWGYALARQGFRTYVFDQPGHGESGRTLPSWRFSTTETPLEDNLAALVNDLVQSGKAVPGRIALVGHSMGAHTVVATARKDDRIAATVAISGGVGEALSDNRPANLLALVADRDPLSIQRTVAAMARTARVVPGKNHITIVYDAEVINEAVRWIHQSLGTPTPSGPGGAAPWGLVWIALAAAMGVVLTGASILAPSAIRNGGVTVRIGPETGLMLLAIAALTSTLAGVYIRIPKVGVAVVDYLLPYFLVMAAVLLALRLLWPRDFAFPVTQGQELLPVSLLRGAGVFVGYVGAVGTVLHMNLSSYIPFGPRILPVLLLAAGFWPYLAQEEGLKRAISAGSGAWAAGAVGLGVKLLILGTWLGAGALPNPPAFLPLVTPVAAMVLIMLELVGLMLRRWQYSPAAIATFAAMVLGWSMGVTFPLV